MKMKLSEFVKRYAGREIVYGNGDPGAARWTSNFEPPNADDERPMHDYQKSVIEGYRSKHGMHYGEICQSALGTIIALDDLSYKQANYLIITGSSMVAEKIETARLAGKKAAHARAYDGGEDSPDAIDPY